MFRVAAPIAAPVRARAGDYVMVEIAADGAGPTLSVVSRSEPDAETLGAIAALVSSGALSALDDGAAVQLAELARSPDARELKQVTPRASWRAGRRHALSIAGSRRRDPGR